MKKTIKVTDIWHEIEQLVMAEYKAHKDGRKNFESNCADQIDILLLIIIRYGRTLDSTSMLMESELDDIYNHYFEIRDKCLERVIKESSDNLSNEYIDNDVKVVNEIVKGELK